jgi:hypothetical protein
VYGDRGAKIKRKLPYLILIIIFKLFVCFIKMGREFCSSLHTFSFAKTTKNGRLLHLIISFDFVVLQNVIEFNKFFFKI